MQQAASREARWTKRVSWVIRACITMVTTIQGLMDFFGEWDAQSYVMGTDVSEIQHPAIQADDGSVLYYFPGLQGGYTPYSTLLPGAVIGVDGQYLAHQSYYPSPISSQPFVSTGVFTQPFAYGPELFPAYPLDPAVFSPDGFQGSIVSADSTNPCSKSSFSAQSRNLSPKTLPTSKAASEVKASTVASAISQTSAVQHQSYKPMNKATAAFLSKGYLPVNKFPLFSNQGNDGLQDSNSRTSIKENAQNWSGGDKLKARNKLNGDCDFDLLNEQNRGPRTNASKSTCNTGVNLMELPNATKKDNSNGLMAIVDMNEHNNPDFQTKYEHALFFVIKSYSEDDIHKSIKYNVWASTPNGNKRLDNAFQVAQEKMAEKGCKCPVFLFFSVNASGQFCGIAEMIGRVDFSKNMDFWQQDKWNGFFPVKWHIIKDIPNPQFRHIILENNDNKPVTNSRDTQEVKFPQGIEMLNIFKSYSSKTSILDDFGFYENRQRAMQDKRGKQHPNAMHSLPKNDELTQGSKKADSSVKACDCETIGLPASNTKEDVSTAVATKE